MSSPTLKVEIEVSEEAIIVEPAWIKICDGETDAATLLAYLIKHDDQGEAVGENGWQTSDVGTICEATGMNEACVEYGLIELESRNLVELRMIGSGDDVEEEVRVDLAVLGQKISNL